MARYLKIVLEKKGRIWLDYVEIDRYMPQLLWGVIRNLNQDGDDIACEYFTVFDHGLFANISAAFCDALKLLNVGIFVRKIDFSGSMSSFKNKGNKDLYYDLFDSSRAQFKPLIVNNVEFEVWDVNHKIYKRLALADLSKAANLIFPPSMVVRNEVHNFIEEVDINLKETVAICYRGTDKKDEVEPAAIERYIEVVEEICDVAGFAFNVLIQTDQKQARDAVIKHFGSRARYSKVLPVTEGDVAIHNLEFGEEIKLTREEFAIKFMASVRVISQCEYVVTHTGNVGAWIAILRGEHRNLFQFGADGLLYRP